MGRERNRTWGGKLVGNQFIAVCWNQTVMIESPFGSGIDEVRGSFQVVEFDIVQDCGEQKKIEGRSGMTGGQVWQAMTLNMTMAQGATYMELVDALFLGRW